MADADSEPIDAAAFPCSLYVCPSKAPHRPQILTALGHSRTISIPFPTARLAHTALRALRVDKELSPLVRRSFDLASPLSSSTVTRSSTDQTTSPADPAPTKSTAEATPPAQDDEKTVLVTHYAATTNRMLRVATNGFFESAGVVLAAMRELDVDVAGAEWRGDWDAESAAGDGEKDEREEEEGQLQRDVRELSRVQGLEAGEAGRIG